MSTLNLLDSALPCSDACDTTATTAINGVSVPVNTTTQQLTTFANEAEVTVTALMGAPQHPLHTAEHMQMDIKQYLARPYRYANGVVAGSAGRLLLQVLNANNVPLLQPRISNLTGVFGYRATICVRLEVAANPFTPGVLKLCYYPASQIGGGVGVATGGGTIWNEDLTYASRISMLPGVYLDIIEATSAELRIPWVHPQSYATNIKSPTSYTATSGMWGSLVLFQYLGTDVASGTSLPNWTLWTWLEDVELIAAQPASITTAVPQSGFDVIEKEMNAASQPISRALALANRGLSLLNGVPLLSSLTTRASWLVRAMGRTAASFGWSKPRLDDATQRMYPTANAGEQFHTGTTQAISLGASSDNHTSIMSGFAGTTVDEMAFSYILAHKAAIALGNFTTGDAYGTLKYACQVSPSSMFAQPGAANYSLAMRLTTSPGPNTAGSILFPSPSFWIGQCFDLWRGTFTFTVRVAKTKMHTGRVMLWYIPDIYQTGTSTTPTFISPNFAQELSFLNTIWDLREGNVIEFTVPYTSPNAFTQFQSSTGTFGISIIEPLAGPPTVFTSTPFTVEVHSDLTFAFPTGPLYPPAPYLPQANTIYAPQGADMEALQYCTGETFSSVKQMAARASYTSAAAPKLILDPTPFAGGYSTLTGTPATALTVTSPYMLDYLSCAYVFWRGSLNVHLHTQQSATTINCLSGQLDVSPSTYTSTLGNNKAMLSNVHEHNGYCHINVPWYNANPCAFIRPNVNSVINQYQTGDYQPAAGVAINYSSQIQGSIPLNIGVSAGDDFQFGLFVMPPPLIVPWTASTGWTGSYPGFAF
jgi:hypothetical protein